MSDITTPSPRAIGLVVNGQLMSAEAEPRMLLVDFIRHTLQLTGTHVGCEQGVCGACTVIIDGQLARSCLMFAVEADGAVVETVESLGTPDALHPIQEAFRDNHGTQCGFCAPGMLLTTKVLLAENSAPTEDEIRTFLQGNLCRCTGYRGIVAAVHDAAARLRDQDET